MQGTKAHGLCEAGCGRSERRGHGAIQAVTQPPGSRVVGRSARRVQSLLRARCYVKQRIK